LLQEVRPRAHVTRPVAPGNAAQEPEMEGGLRLGQHVIHATFGEGVVTNYEGQGSSARVQVNFTGVGSKWLVLAYAKLQTV
jgi:DNA helicase-2/ATP-dependent DNA helicase PcrA